MSERTEGVSVTLPAGDLEQVREIVKAGGAKSVSSFVAQALRDRLTRQQRAERAVALTHELFGNPADLSAEQQAEVAKRVARAESAARENALRAYTPGQAAA